MDGRICIKIPGLPEAVTNEKAADYLKQQGLFILRYNYRCRFGEIDLIARDGEYLVFVEVKYRKDNSSGYSLAAVNPAKQKTICKVARYFLTVEYHNVDIPCRFDVAGIDGDEIHWVKNAFELYCNPLIIIETALMNILPYSRKGIMKYEDKMEQ